MRLPPLSIVVLGLFFGQRPILSQGYGGTIGVGGNDTKTLIAGENAPAGRFSYMCSLRYQGSHGHFCGAMLILPNWILTAAHCIDRGEDNAPVRPIVYCGIDRLNQTDPDLTFGAGPSYIHERWSGNEFHGYDVALLRLDRDSSSALEDLPELDAGDNSFDAGEYLTALGWGTTQTSENSTELQMTRTLEFVPSDTCNEDWWGGNIKEERMICAGLRKESVCKGDSGGPLIRPDNPQGKLNLGRTSRDLIVGITSFNYQSERCGKQERPAVFTSVAFFVDWMSDTVGEDVTKGRGPVHSSRSLTEPKSGKKPLSDLLLLELLEEMKKALKKDDGVRAKRILKFLHFNETLEAGIPDAGRSYIPLLHAAAMFDAPECAQVLIDAGADVESQTDDYYRLAPLHVCGIFGSTKVAKVLLNRKNGAFVNSNDSVGDTAMHKAATYGHVELMEFLVGKSADEDKHPTNSFDESPLHEAARVGHVDVVKFLLKKGANISHPNENGWTALHYGSFNNHTAVVEVLLKDGAKVNAEDFIGQTPLHKACWRGNEEVVRMLLLNRANMLHRDNWGYTAMHHAIWNEHIEPVKLLLRSGVSANTASNSGYTALHSAGASGYTAIARLLIAERAAIEAVDDDGRTPLSRAVDRGNVEMVKLLIKEGARVDTYRDTWGRTLLHVASRNGNVKIVKVLLRNGADVYATKNGEETPLHEAAENGQHEVVQVLLDAGALKNVRGRYGDTPRSEACGYEHCSSTERYALDFMLQT